MFCRTKNVVFTKFEFLERRVLASTQNSCVLYPDKNRILLNVSHFTKQKNHSNGKPSGEDQKTPQGGMIRMCCLHILWKNRMAPIENGMVFSCYKMEQGMEQFSSSESSTVGDFLFVLHKVDQFSILEGACQSILASSIHRRRIKTEEKTKVVAAVWSIPCRASYVFCTRMI